MFTSELDKLLISESFKDEEVEETCDAQHSEITSPDDGSGVKGNVGGKDIETEGFMWYECDIDEANVIDGDPFEFLTEAMYQNVINANNISIAVLADKYKYLRENGEEMIGEAAEAQDEKKKGAIRKWFKKVGDALSKFIQSVLDKMIRLQAKFLMLFKKAQTASSAGLKAKGIQTPQWDIDDVKTWQKTELENAKIKGQTNDFPNRDVKNDAVFETELKIIKGYGKAIKAVKEVGNDAQKKLKEAANNCSKNANGVSYAKIGNAISSVTKEAVSLIMERVNAAAKAVTASLKKEKPAKEDKKAKEQPKADDKKTATGESASFLDSLDFI